MKHSKMSESNKISYYHAHLTPSVQGDNDSFEICIQDIINKRLCVNLSVLVVHTMYTLLLSLLVS